MKTVSGDILLVSCLQHSFLQALDVGDVCRLHGTSKALGRRIMETFKVDNCDTGRQMLRRVVLQASSAVGPHAASQHVGAMRWLLSQASLPGQLMVDDSPSLISIPKVPFAMVELLVGAGARITYQQLVAAARSQVEGVHVWVTAQQQLGAPNDLPRAVEAVCRYGAGGNWATSAPSQLVLPQPMIARGMLTDLTLDELVDLLYITLNMLPGDTGSMWFEDTVIEIATELVWRHIDSGCAMQLCKTAMQICSTRAVGMDLAVTCISSVLSLHTLADSPPPAVYDLLLLALQLGVPAIIWHEMCYESQAVLFEGAQSQTLLAAAVTATVQHASQQTEHYTYLKACRELAGVLSDDIDSVLAGTLLQAAVAAVINCNSHRTGDKLQELLTALPAAVVNKVDGDVIAELIQTVVQDSSTLSTLCQLPAASKVRPAAVLKAFKAALGVGNADSLSRLLELKGAAGISAAQVAELIIPAVAQDSDTLSLLCQLPAANEVNPAAVLQALKAALGVGNADSLSRLVELKGAAGISAAEVAELIITALGPKQHQEREPQASISQVPQADLPLSLKRALLHPDFRLVYFLCQLKEAENIPVDRLAVLLEVAVQHGDSLDVQALTLLPRARQLDRGFVQLLMEMARSCGSVFTERALTRLQANMSDNTTTIT